MEDTVDIVVVGAGTAGANTAYQFARRGRRVVLLERRPADEGGAQWHNGVLDRHFELAGLDPPVGAERGPAPGAVHLRSRDPRIGPNLSTAPTVAADMALLGRRLRKLAEEAGTEIIDEVEDLDVDVDPDTGRVLGVRIRAAGGAANTTIRAALVVDASGRRGVVRRVAPDLQRWCPPLPQDELCSASDVHHEIVDPAGAEAFLERHGAVPGDSVTYVGIAGGFSTCAITVSADLHHVGMVTGCLANGRYSTGPRIVADRCKQEPWIGPAVNTGSGVIPLRRPYARLTAPGVALVGDAACQVFPAHGSGIGVGLVAGSMLAEGVAGVDDPGDAAELWRRYQAPFQRSHGADLIAYDELRRATTRLGSDGVDALLRSGLMGEHTTQAGLEQRWAVPPVTESVRSVAKFIRHPTLAAVMVPALARAQLLRAHATRYPEELDTEALAKWEQRAEGLLGSLPS